MGTYIIGIDAGGTKVAYGLFDEAGALLARGQYPTDREADGAGFCDTLIAALRAFVRENGIGFDEIAHIGICMPSYLYFEKGIVVQTTAIPGIRDFPLRDYLAARLSVPLILDNDSNAAALAEYRRGAGRGSRHMVYMAVSTGVGSGLILDGKLFRGSYGWAGECGHMLLQPDEGVLCGCRNRGCAMSLANGGYIGQRIRARLDAGAVSSLSDCGEIDGPALLRACREGDETALAELSSMAHWLAVCAFNVYQMLNINLFVFGGGLVTFGSLLFDQIRAEFDRYDHLHYPVDFRFAELDRDVGIIGAAELGKESSR
ncbi:MAG: ROK family protein [Oscillospiraceae bacterium]|nr:ROK family protein [Oscillospiraceae bacterium]